MIPYNKTTWKDHVTDPVTGEVIQQGTPQSATNFNNIEDGVFAADAAFSVITQQVMQHKRGLVDLEGEILTKTLTNNQSYPFNNSVQSVAMVKARDTLNYRVAVEITSAIGGFIGNISITEKALNGFNVAFDGSATSVVLKMYVQGGMYS